MCGVSINNVRVGMNEATVHYSLPMPSKNTTGEVIAVLSLIQKVYFTDLEP